MQYIKVILDRFFDDSVILITETGKQILWPKDKLPDDIQPGQIFYLTLNSKLPDRNNLSQPETKPTDSKDHKKIAQAILEEILNVEEQEKIK